MMLQLVVLMLAVLSATSADTMDPRIIHAQTQPLEHQRAEAREHIAATGDLEPSASSNSFYTAPSANAPLNLDSFAAPSPAQTVSYQAAAPVVSDPWPTQVPQDYVFRTGSTLYSDPGFDVGVKPVGFQISNLINTVLTVAIGLFAISLVIQIVQKFTGTALMKELMDQRSLEQTFGELNPERLSGLHDLVLKAFDVYEKFNN